jgi:hypothetical protein
VQKLLVALLGRWMILPLLGHLFVPHPKKLKLDIGADPVLELAHKSVIKMGHVFPYGPSSSVRPDWCV